MSCSRGLGTDQRWAQEGSAYKYGGEWRRVSAHHSVPSYPSGPFLNIRLEGWAGSRSRARSAMGEKGRGNKKVRGGGEIQRG